MNFLQILDKYRNLSISERDKGNKFEVLIKYFFKTNPQYNLKDIWLWSEFPYREQLGGIDLGIDLVILNNDGHYWAVQCKCYASDSYIDKKGVDSFLSNSGSFFIDEDNNKSIFSQRLLVSTTNNWSKNVEKALKSQKIPVNRINLSDLESAPINWLKLEQGIIGEEARVPKKSIREHQKEALDKTHDYLKNNDRGKLIMACGTGKTFTSLKIAENETKGNGIVLFLVPSIALLGQTLNEWTAESHYKINPICICSDARVAQKNELIDLAIPASTNEKSIIRQLDNLKNLESKFTVVFSTYQSIEVIAKAQKEFTKKSKGAFEFDLIICDEAHRTTGVALKKEDSSHFIKVHDNDFIQAKKRLYMTATPRLYGGDSKIKSKENEAILCSMDDEALYGAEIYRIGFGEAVEKNLLTDYKVLILTFSEKDVSQDIQKMLANDNEEISSNDASKLIGCISALSKNILGDNSLLKETDPSFMKRAVAFCQITGNTISKGDFSGTNSKKITEAFNKISETYIDSLDEDKKTNSKKITEAFNKISETYIDSLDEDKKKAVVNVTSKHVDGTMSAPERNKLISWLKDESTKQNECKILTNVRCLSEGVDVPSLDAVLFLSARNSEIDIVQSVGRVMRKSEGKKYGYIIIPVMIPSGSSPEKALSNNKNFKIVWKVLKGLRAHDENFNSIINKIDLNKQKSNNILIASNAFGDGANEALNESLQMELPLIFEQTQSVIYAKIVEKVGEKRYWEQWAKDIAKKAEEQILKIGKLIENKEEYKIAFDDFIDGLKKNINPLIEKEDAIEMLSQHIITKPVFEALFENYSFAENNSVSIAMQSILKLLQEDDIDKDIKDFERFYKSVRTRVEGIDNAEAKQKIIVELYDKFFKTAFPKMVDKLGIVYTPVEIVDFIINSTQDILKKEFNRDITDKNVHILDPFTGTGTFITRLLQSGLIKEKDLARKYKNEIHCNEIVLLAYYIAAVNIENSYHDIIKEDNYESFDGICLTDSFQLGETGEDKKLFSKVFPHNSRRVMEQKKSPIKIIIGNPPYSIGQKSANDDAQNQNYPKLSNAIEDSYVKKSNAGLNKSAYDSYIKAFRWASDRLDEKEGGIIAFITNSRWLDSISLDGFRKSLEDEFLSIYSLDLKGYIRAKTGDIAKKEGGNVFDIMTGVAITILVKKPNDKKKGKIFYNDIGDYLSRKDKLEIIKNAKSFSNIKWQEIKPNKKGDWINQRSEKFNEFIPLAPVNKYKENKTIFNLNGPAVSTARDSWVYNFSKEKLMSNMKNMISFYNQQREEYSTLENKENKTTIDKFISLDETKIKWTRYLKKSCKNNKNYSFDSNNIMNSFYRPFCKQKLYFEKNFIESIGLNTKLFPNQELKNKVIITTGKGARGKFSVFISDMIIDINSMEAGSQCFPLYYYEKDESNNMNIFEDGDYAKKDAISNFILDKARVLYQKKEIIKEDVFYYIYGLLHSREYQDKFANELKKELAKIPLLKKHDDFVEFSNKGRELADLHINYKKIEPYKDIIIEEKEDALYEVIKMKFPKKEQKDTIIYNKDIIVKNIPLEAYNYEVNGRSAIEWVMDRYQIRTHKDSKIKNNPNDWAKEVSNPRYILDLLLSVINVSMKTLEIINNLPKIDFENV